MDAVDWTRVSSVECLSEQLQLELQPASRVHVVCGIDARSGVLYVFLQIMVGRVAPLVQDADRCEFRCQDLPSTRWAHVASATT